MKRFDQMSINNTGAQESKKYERGQKRMNFKEPNREPKRHEEGQSFPPWTDPSPFDNQSHGIRSLMTWNTKYYRRPPPPPEENYRENCYRSRIYRNMYRPH